MKQAVSVDGVFLLDKPLGLSSNQALCRAKYLFNAKKAGHTGTLDPLATGLLPICLGEATKFAQDLLDANKTYEADIYLGKTTTTGDAEGEVVAETTVNCHAEAIQQALQKFTGIIKQIPPMYSALKKEGKPLYQYARAGQTITRQERDVEIHRLDLLQFHLPVIKVRVTCSKGTYIRTLAEDIGQFLGCGAHLSALRRTAIDKLNVSQAISLENLILLDPIQRTQKLLPLDVLIQHLPTINLSTELAQRFLYGQRLPMDTSSSTELFRVYHEMHLLGLAQLDHGILRPKRLIKQN